MILTEVSSMLYHVSDPERYGVVEFDADKKKGHFH